MASMLPSGDYLDDRGRYVDPDEPLDRYQSGDWDGTAGTRDWVDARWGEFTAPEDAAEDAAGR